MRTAFVYDRVNKIGGAERVLEVLHEIYPRAPLFTAVYDPQKTTWAAGWDIRPSFLNKFPYAKSTHELYPWLTPLAFESFDFSNFDIVISITSAEAKGIITKPNTLHICYCLTPTRYLWSGFEIYKESMPKWLQLFSKPIFSYLRNWDRVASTRVDKYLAISELVQKRIGKYYNQESDVIYPPVDLSRFKPGKAIKSKTNFFLVVSRLVPYKRVDLAIKACNMLKLPLVVVGKGMEYKKLSKLAGPTIDMLGEVSEQKLIELFNTCQALIVPQEEEFGITLVEAQAAGKPVIALNRGGAREIIKSQSTGIFFSNQSVPALMQAIKRFDRLKFIPQNARKNAQRFNKDKFIKLFSNKVEEEWHKYKTLTK